MEQDLNIYKSKALADGFKYFSLYEKHIPELDGSSNVYLFMLSNVGCICEIIQKNPLAKYWIYDSDSIVEAVKMVIDGTSLEKTQDIYNINDMKFDCIIMNPPYEGQTNLYGKITLEAKKHSDVVVCLSPYLNYISDKKSFKETAEELEQTLESYDFVDPSTFDAAFDKSLCVFKFGKRNENVRFEDLFWSKFSNKVMAKSILSKIEKKKDFCSSHVISKNKFDNFNYKCVMTFKRGHFDKQNGHPNWDWTTLFAKDYQEKFDWKEQDIKTPNCQAIPFETESECINFCNYCNSDIAMFIIYAHKVSLSQSSNLQYIPFLSYKNNLAESDITKEFELTKDELEYIHQEMKDFGWKTQK